MELIDRGIWDERITFLLQVCNQTIAKSQPVDRELTVWPSRNFAIGWPQFHDCKCAPLEEEEKKLMQ